MSQRTDRECWYQCLIREIKERMSDAGMPNSSLDGVSFNKIRTVFEGPNNLPGYSYFEVKLFLVFELRMDSTFSNDLIELIKNDISSGNNYFAIVTLDEIKRGRSKDGRALTHTCEYLWKDESKLPKLPPQVIDK
ncbi:MAG: hypothetical protein QM758_05380 [Armatimonas sp.]